MSHLKIRVFHRGFVCLIPLIFAVSLCSSDARGKNSESFEELNDGPGNWIDQETFTVGGGWGSPVGFYAEGGGLWGQYYNGGASPVAAARGWTVGGVIGTQGQMAHAGYAFAGGVVYAYITAKLLGSYLHRWPDAHYLGPRATLMLVLPVGITGGWFFPVGGRNAKESIPHLGVHFGF